MILIFTLANTCTIKYRSQYVQNCTLPFWHNWWQFSGSWEPELWSWHQAWKVKAKNSLSCLGAVSLLMIRRYHDWQASLSLKPHLERYNEHVTDFQIIDTCTCIESDTNTHIHKTVYTFFKGGGAVEMKWGWGLQIVASALIGYFLTFFFLIGKGHRGIGRRNVAHCSKCIKWVFVSFMHSHWNQIKFITPFLVTFQVHTKHWSLCQSIFSNTVQF